MQIKVKLSGYDHWKHVTIVRRPMSCGCGPTLEDLICEALMEQCEMSRDEMLEEKILAYRVLSERREVGVTTLRIVEMWRLFGGPEEGGWFYDAEHLVREIVVPTRRLGTAMGRLIMYCQRANEGHRVGDGRLAVKVGPYVGEPRPHYC